VEEQGEISTNVAYGYRRVRLGGPRQRDGASTK